MCATPWGSPTTEPALPDARPTSNPLARAPSPWVLRFAAHLAPGARVLDLACGHGRHARWLAARDCAVTAIDADAACAESLAGVAGVTFRCYDLEAAPWPIAARSFDAVVVVHYLHRPLLPRLAECLDEGGLLVYETFARGNEVFGRPRSPDFLLAPRELLQAFASLRVLAFEDGVQAEPPAMIQRIAALRLAPTASAPLERLQL
jgi:SAM-dependent methyltransferase